MVETLEAKTKVLTQKVKEANFVAEAKACTRGPHQSARDSNLVFSLACKQISLICSLGLTFEHEVKTVIIIS